MVKILVKYSVGEDNIINSKMKTCKEKMQVIFCIGTVQFKVKSENALPSVLNSDL